MASAFHWVRQEVGLVLSQQANSPPQPADHSMQAGPRSGLRAAPHQRSKLNFKDNA